MRVSLVSGLQFVGGLSAGTIRRNNTPRREGVFSARQLVPASGTFQNHIIVERPRGRMTRGGAIEVLGIPASQAEQNPLVFYVLPERTLLQSARAYVWQ